ncbi:MAG: hypothetical protein FJ304_05555 [Planctomycetes bacterium]|nr:hypothetical protein [Planctomycetota bacterium]
MRKAHAVSAADAGESLNWACGRTVDVPPLHQLRASVGEEALSPAVRIQSLLLAGQLPGTNLCAVCSATTSKRVLIGIECERGELKPGPASRTTAGIGCLFGMAIGGLGGLFAGNRVMQSSNDTAGAKYVGQDVAFELPLPVCTGCRAGLNDRTALIKALRFVPEYAALLDRYPNAEVKRIS